MKRYLCPLVQKTGGWGLSVLVVTVKFSESGNVDFKKGVGDGWICRIGLQG